MTPPLKAPFPWFGGKSRVAHLVWDYFGDVRNYVEPFAGSLAVLLGRPTEPKIETANDLDCWISNFWRALEHDPEQLAAWADHPVNECDLHARHLWLVHQTEFRERMKTDPDYYDVKIAGWWVWGICQWIGSGWCQTTERRRKDGKGEWFTERTLPCENLDTRMHLTSEQGIQTAAKRPYLTNPGMGVHRPQLITPGRTNAGRQARGINGIVQKRPRLGNDNGRGVLSADVPDQVPNLRGDSGAAGCGIHASGLPWHKPGRQRVRADGLPVNARPCMQPSGLQSTSGGLYDWFYALADRLRRVRVCCGDWKRVLGPAPTTCIGTTAVFLDPPYAVEERSDVYGEESREVAHEVREWALKNGDNPELRIALCGYDAPDYQMPDTWTEVAWTANGGYANQSGDTRGKKNAHRERIWFSPYCLTKQGSLFAPAASVLPERPATA